MPDCISIIPTIISDRAASASTICNHHTSSSITFVVSLHVINQFIISIFLFILEQASDRFRKEKKRVIVPQITQTENVALTYASAIDDMQARTISCVLLLFPSAACVCSKKQTFINLLYYILLYDALLQLERGG